MTPGTGPPEGGSRKDGAMAEGNIVYVTSEIDPTKTVMATRQCGCPIYLEDGPRIKEWMCEHGNYWSSAR